MTGCGKTTLVKEAFDLPYVSLRDMEAKALAMKDPQLFFDAYQKNHRQLIIDDFHLVPSLMKALGEQVEQDNRFILVTSKRLDSGNLPCTHITLYPPSQEELKSKKNLEETLWCGGLAALQPDRSPQEVYQEFWGRLIEEQIPRALRLTLPEAFVSFVKLCAGMIGQTVNYSRLGDNCGVSHNSCRAWMKALQDYYVVDLLSPYKEGYGRRVVRTPKLYFTDTGCAAYLLGIRGGEDLLTHYSRGALFENYVLGELRKQRSDEEFWFWQDKQGTEIDLLLEKKGKLQPIELKAGRTISASYFDGLNSWSQLTGADPKEGTIIYGGEENHSHPMGRLYGWNSIDKLEMTNTNKAES
jgi:predicted AAA+ superfamily ATPase